MSQVKIQTTRNYRLFERHSGENRPLDAKKHRPLLESMKLYGFLRVYPIICFRNAKGKLIVKDGQHRLMIAETLALPVHFVIDDVDFDVALVNSGQKPWQIRDYAQKYADSGVQSYIDAMAFSESHSIPIGVSFAILSGTISFRNIQNSFQNGTWEIRDRPWADAVAGIYAPLTQMSSALRNKRCLEACMAVCRVKSFDATRLISGAQRCREKLIGYSTKDAYLDMLEVIYNFGRKQLVGLKAAALMAMRERNILNNPLSGKGGRPSKNEGKSCQNEDTPSEK